MLYTVSRTSEVLLTGVFLALPGEDLGFGIGGETGGGEGPVFPATPVGVSGGGTILKSELFLPVSEPDLPSKVEDGRGGSNGDSICVNGLGPGLN